MNQLRGTLYGLSSALLLVLQASLTQEKKKHDYSVSLTAFGAFFLKKKGGIFGTDV